MTRSFALPAAVLALTLASAPARAAEFKLEPGKSIELACETKSVVVATDAAKATNGKLRLKLERSAGEALPSSGTWRIVAVDADHKGSLGHAQAKTCEAGCPLSIAAEDQIQLWAPAAKGLDKLAEGEPLMLAVVKADGKLRVSTFRGPQIEALEEGSCRPAP